MCFAVYLPYFSLVSLAFILFLGRLVFNVSPILICTIHVLSKKLFRLLFEIEISRFQERCPKNGVNIQLTNPLQFVNSSS